MTHTPTPQHGFNMLRRMQELKLDFDAAGPNGHVSFAKACIWSGLMRKEEITAEACAIAGEHLEGVFMTLLDEGENIHWRRCENDTLDLITEA
ncbi:hypothetical protein [Erythrobacter sp.]|uniref:hypothetical protein n=1 Tax=Erythrobacter sp. TaxID=1042 RepID=UPI0025D27CCB|nr:hypothetical protein [Erythrobacter sp.]